MANHSLEAETRTAFNIHHVLTQGIERFEAGRLDEAKDRFLAVLQAGPIIAEAHYRMGLIHARNGENRAALTSIEKALELSPDRVAFMLDYAAVLSFVGRKEDAGKILLRAHNLDPCDVNVLYRLGESLEEQQRLPVAEECFRRVVACMPDRAEAHFKLATVLALQERRLEALKHFQATVDIIPAHPLANWWAAEILNGEGRYEEAKPHMDALYRLKNVYVTPSETAKRTVLIVADAGTGNVPLHFLLPQQENNTVKWMAQYAAPGQEAQLPPYDVAFNTCGNPDVPPFGPAVLEYLKNCGKRVLNWPEKIPRTARERMTEMFGGIPGVCVPRVWRIEKQGDWGTVTDRDLPILTRPIGTQGGVGLTLVETPAALAEAKAGGAKLYVTSYVDYRSADGYYRKYRTIFVDRKPYPYHLAISDIWLVHYYRADMASMPAKLEEERRFLDDPAAVLGPEGLAALEAVGRALDLEYAGADYSILPDGRLLLFEANATMCVHAENEEEVLGFKNPYVHRIKEAFTRLLTDTSPLEGPAISTEAT